MFLTFYNPKRCNFSQHDLFIKYIQSGFGSVLLFNMKPEVLKCHYLIPDQSSNAKRSQEVQVYYVKYSALWSALLKFDVCDDSVCNHMHSSTAITQSVGLFLPRSALTWSDEGVDLGQSSFGHYSVPDH